MKKWKVVLCLFLLAGLSLADDRAPGKFVRVTGTAEVKVVPDRAVILLGVQKQDSRASVAKHAEDAAARKILASLKASGIDERDIQTTYLSLQPQTRYVKKVRVSYFVAQQTLTVTVRDLSKLDFLLEEIVQAGGNRIDSISYEIGDLRKYRDQARDLAVKAAREKATALAHALGQDVGKAQSIEEAQNYEAYSASNTIQNGFSYDGAPTRAAGPSLAVGQTSISASVTVAFELN
jgi:uncharacterized protein